MVELSVVAAFWLVSLMFVVTPGADWAYAISAGLRHRTVLPAVGGMLAGHLAVTIAVAAGVAALVSRSDSAMSLLMILGAVYLLWLGVGMLTGPASQIADGGFEATSKMRQTMKGLGVSGLNPKVLLLLLALLPQFTNPDAGWPLAGQILALGGIHVSSSAVVYLAVARSSSRVLRARPTAAKIVSKVSGAAMVVIGGGLVVETFVR